MGDGTPATDKKREQQFREFYNRHFSQMVDYVFYLIGDFEQAQEMVQDVFVRAYRNIDSLMTDQQTTGYLYTACKNAIKNEYRRRSRLKSGFGKTVFVDTDKYDAFFKEASSQEDEFLKSEEEKRVLRCLDRLKLEDREIILLKEFMGQRYEEIAETFQTTTTVVRGRLHKARKRLRKLLLEEFGGVPGQSPG